MQWYLAYRLASMQHMKFIDSMGSSYKNSHRECLTTKAHFFTHFREYILRTRRCWNWHLVFKSRDAVQVEAGQACVPQGRGDHLNGVVQPKAKNRPELKFNKNMLKQPLMLPKRHSCHKMSKNWWNMIITLFSDSVAETISMELFSP